MDLNVEGKVVGEVVMGQVPFRIRGLGFKLTHLAAIQ